eukprot:SAG31_NODE_5316_length_2613_cov_3.281225_2_plen_472_part_00
MKVAATRAALNQIMAAKILATVAAAGGGDVMMVAPGANEFARCVASKKIRRCHLLPGVHTESVLVDSNRDEPLQITGDGTDTVLSGALAVPGPWTLHRGHIYKAELPKELQLSDIQQAWCGPVGSQTAIWLPEARWPDVNLTADGPANAPGGPLSLSSWAKTDTSTSLRRGIIVDSSLAKTDVDWTGALATLNVGVRYYTWTKRVLNHTKGSDRFSYNQSLPNGGVVGMGKLDQGEDNLYFLSGKLDALDSPGEHFIDEATWTMYVWAPDSRPPVDVWVKVKDWCIKGKASLRNVSLFGCTWHLQGNGLAISNVSLNFPTYHKTIDPRGTVTGPFPAMTTLEGNDSVISKFHMRYAQNGGLKIIGSRNRIEEALIEDMTWLASLDFPPIELGFGFANPTDDGAIILDNNTHGLFNSAVWGGISAFEGNPAPTVGDQNIVTRSTLRRMGEMGVVTSQLSNEVRAPEFIFAAV